VLPYLREYEAVAKLREGDRLAEATAKLNNLEVLAERIAGATSQWQAVQDRARQTAEMARETVERLTRDADALASTVARTADSEKQNLKLEAAKLRRAEGDWLQAAGRVMDHVFALHVAAVRSSQPAVREQMDRFHAACREALRRVGFVSIVAAPDELFDPRKHQTVDGSPPAEGARVDETVAPGFVFQGQMLRPVVVRVGAKQAAPAGRPSGVALNEAGLGSQPPTGSATSSADPANSESALDGDSRVAPTGGA
jgi:hypothetical protein